MVPYEAQELDWRADNQAPACRTDNERSRADSVSQALFLLRPWTLLLSRACWIVFCERFELSSCAILEQRSWKTWQIFGLFLNQDLQRREQNRRMMLYTWYWRAPNHERVLSRVARVGLLRVVGHQILLGI